MIRFHTFRFLFTVLCLSVFIFAVNIRTALAESISTSEVIDSAEGDSARAQLNAFLARQDVEKTLIAYGVSAAEAHSRIATLSNSEATELALRVNDAPIAGDGIGTVVVALLVVFVVLLVTDVLGLTKVYPFTRPVHSR